MSPLALCVVCVSERRDVVNMSSLYYGSIPASTFIMDILQIKVASDTSSGVVMCNRCNSSLNNFYKFYKMVRDAQHKYNEIHNTETMKDECDNYVYLDNTDCFNSCERQTVKDEGCESKENCTKDKDLSVEKYKLSEMLIDDGFTLNQQQRNEMFNSYFNMKCEHCSDTFSSYEELNSHSMNVHKAPSRVKCCNYYAKDQRMMELHILRRHINTNKPPPLKVPCKVCNKMITTTGYRKHLINHLPPEKRTFKCQQCAAGFAKACLLKNHVERCHKAEAVQCNVCSKTIRSKACLSAHIRRVHGPSQEYLCPECGKSYKNYDNYTSHMKKHSGEEDKVKCPKCDAVIKRCSLRCHLRRHEPNMKKQCPYCPHKAIHGLSEHIKRVHDKLKRFSCTVCPMKFYSELSLKDHTSSRHTGIPEYSCEFCGKTFMNSGNYHVHRKKLHPTQLAEKKLETTNNKLNENVPVYDPEAPKKKTAQQGIEADLILKDLQKKKKPS